MIIKGAKSLDEGESKSKQEIENELIEKKEQQDKAVAGVVKDDDSATKQEEKVGTELTDSDVLTHLKNKYGKDIRSMDELMAEREAAPELPDDVSAFFKYKKETGRGIEDFVKLNKSYDDVDASSAIREYYKMTKEGLDDDDIDAIIESDFGFDEDLDDESDIKLKKIAQKQELNKAKKFFEEQKEKYNAPLESRAADSQEAEDIKLYRDKMKAAEGVEADNKVKSEWFSKKTDELFTEDFKGFEFEIGDKKMTYKPAETAEIKESNQSPFNFIQKHLGEDGLLKDAEGYHRSLSIAMNPEKFAKYFYEQGQATAVDDYSKKSKNIKMDTRNVPAIASTGGMKVRVVDPQTRGNGLTIKRQK